MNYKITLVCACCTLSRCCSLPSWLSPTFFVPSTWCNWPFAKSHPLGYCCYAGQAFPSCRLYNEAHSKSLVIFDTMAPWFHTHRWNKAGFSTRQTSILQAEMTIVASIFYRIMLLASRTDWKLCLTRNKKYEIYGHMHDIKLKDELYVSRPKVIVLTSWWSMQKTRK